MACRGQPGIAERIGLGAIPGVAPRVVQAAEHLRPPFQVARLELDCILYRLCAVGGKRQRRVA